MHKYRGKEKFGREGGSEKQAAANAHLLSVSAVLRFLSPETCALDGFAQFEHGDRGECQGNGD